MSPSVGSLDIWFSHLYNHWFPTSISTLTTVTRIDVLEVGIKQANRDALFSSPSSEVFIIHTVAVVFFIKDAANVPEQNSSGAIVNGNHYIRCQHCFSFTSIHQSVSSQAFKKERKIFLVEESDLGWHHMYVSAERNQIS